MPKKVVLACLINFLVAALMGLALRYSFLEPIELNYRFLTHAHSHVAMLGWVYLMLYVFFVHYFVPQKKPIYTKLFWLTQGAVVGMMLSFPFQGYALVSIVFSSLHIFCSYYFVYRIWKDISIKNIAVRILAKTALVFMLLSTLGVWCLGPAVRLLGQASAFYQITIQFFLHFQFNGWFLIAALALFFHFLKIENSKVFQRFYKLLVSSTVLTFALPVLWFIPQKFLIVINAIGIFLQLAAFVYFIKLIQIKLRKYTEKASKLARGLLYFTLTCFALKTALQMVTLVPEFSQVIFTHRNFVIGFIHLIMLGIITGFLFSFLVNAVPSSSKTLKIGVFCFLLGITLTEIMLAVQGGLYYLKIGLLPHYYVCLFLFSTLLPLGIFLISLHIYRIKWPSA